MPVVRFALPLPLPARVMVMDLVAELQQFTQKLYLAVPPMDYVTTNITFAKT